MGRKTVLGYDRASSQFYNRACWAGGLYVCVGVGRSKNVGLWDGRLFVLSYNADWGGGVINRKLEGEGDVGWVVACGRVCRRLSSSY